jgi:hypothetical protein
MEYKEKIEVARRMAEPYAKDSFKDDILLFIDFPSESMADEWALKLTELGVCLVEKIGVSLLFYGGGPEEDWLEKEREVIREWKSKHE